ncbi:MAG: FAD:protein FMN transferase, partial [Vicinamibacterales bacterium]
MLPSRLQLINAAIRFARFSTRVIFIDEFFPKGVRAIAQGLFNLMILGVGPLVANVIGAHRYGTPLHHYEASRLSMACVYAIDAYGPDAAALPRILDDAFDEVDRIDRLMSHYKADSPLSRINRDAARHPVTVDPELFDFIAESRRYDRESGGAFDITVGPLMKAWGFFRGEGRKPSDEEL